mmetsp:Transcript_23470/g.49300  ORF Transcript_23470/g.49300 Transcript_23470/m.49300 type:complete len:557 (-) Transcript_23470:110-1780(-)
MRAHRRTNEVVRVPDVGDPVRHGLVDGVLERGLTVVDRDDLGPERVHSKDVELLALAIDGAHVHGAVQAQHGADRGRGHPVLAGPRFGNDAGLADALGQEGLADRVVDLVGTGVRQVFSLQPDGGPPGHFGQALGLVQGGGPAHEFSAVAVQFGQERGVVLDFVVGLLDLLKGHREGFRDVLAAEFSEPCLVVGLGPFFGDLSQFRGLVLGVLRLCHAGGQVRDDVADGVGLLFRGGIVPQVLHGVEDGTSHHDPVRQVGDAVYHLGGGDSEADRQGQVGRFADPLQEFVQIRGEFRPGPGDTRDGDAVQKGGGHLGQGLDSLVAAGGGHQRDVGKTVLEAGLVERDALLRGQIDDDETVGSGFLGVRAQFVLAVLQKGVDVSHEDHRNGESHFPCLLDHSEAGSDVGCSIGNGNFIGGRDGGTIGFWVRVWGTELDNGRSSLLHGQEDGWSVFFGRVSGGDERNKSSLPLGLGGFERILQASSDSSSHFCDRNRVRRCYVQCNVLSPAAVLIRCLETSPRGWRWRLRLRWNGSPRDCRKRTRRGRKGAGRQPCRK